MNEIKVGDIVCLISGGPAMTICRLNFGRNEEIRCEWFAETELRSGVFFKECLRKASTVILSSAS